MYGMLTRDVDGDGNLDIITTGNQYTAEPVFGNYDASHGVWLRGDGTGHFTPIPAAQSGLFLGDDQRSIVALRLPAQSVIVAAANAGPLNAYWVGNNTALSSEAVPLAPDEVGVEITFQDGRSTRREYYYGTTYLSQSSRTFELLDEMKDVVIVDSRGGRRKIR